MLLSLVFAGCASNTKTKAQMEHAYAAGVQAGKIQAQQQEMQQAGVPLVKFFGHVKNPVLQWSDGMTLSSALLQADYLDPDTPRAITIYRNGQPTSIDPQRLLAGEDYPLYAGDTVVIQN
jgi:hypothetical protein